MPDMTFTEEEAYGDEPTPEELELLQSSIGTNPYEDSPDPTIDVLRPTWDVSARNARRLDSIAERAGDVAGPEAVAAQTVADDQGEFGYVNNVEPSAKAQWSESSLVPNQEEVMGQARKELGKFQPSNWEAGSDASGDIAIQREWGSEPEAAADTQQQAQPPQDAGSSDSNALSMLAMAAPALLDLLRSRGNSRNRRGPRAAGYNRARHYNDEQRAALYNRLGQERQQMLQRLQQRQQAQRQAFESDRSFQQNSRLTNMQIEAMQRNQARQDADERYTTAQMTPNTPENRALADSMDALGRHEMADAVRRGGVTRQQLENPSTYNQPFQLTRDDRNNAASMARAEMSAQSAQLIAQMNIESRERIAQIMAAARARRASGGGGGGASPVAYTGEELNALQQTYRDGLIGSGQFSEAQATSMAQAFTTELQQAAIKTSASNVFSGQMYNRGEGAEASQAQRFSSELNQVDGPRASVNRAVAAYNALTPEDKQSLTQFLSRQGATWTSVSDAWSPRAAAFARAVDDVISQLAQMRSGKAVSDRERANIRSIVGNNSFRLSSVMNGLANVSDEIGTDERRIAAVYPEQWAAFTGGGNVRVINRSASDVAARTHTAPTPAATPSATPRQSFNPSQPPRFDPARPTRKITYSDGEHVWEQIPGQQAYRLVY